jgi:hypothetical protein
MWEIKRKTGKIGRRPTWVTARERVTPIIGNYFIVSSRARRCPSASVRPAAQRYLVEKVKFVFASWKICVDVSKKKVVLAS